MNKKELWQKICETLSNGTVIKEAQYKAWIKPLKVLHFANGILLIKVADSFSYDFLESSYKERILSVAQNIDSSVKEVRFTTEEDVPLPQIIEVEKEQPQKEKEEKKKKLTTTTPLQPFQHPLNEKYTFNSFILGFDNQFARESALSVAEQPKNNTFSPLYLYASTGLGKSHLLHAIGNLIKKQRPSLSVVLTTADEFYYNYSSSLGKKGKDEGKEYDSFFSLFENCDVLLIDDLQQLSGKVQCQIEFFRIFNTLHQRGTLMVFTADREPNKLLGFDERLISRLEWGLAVEISEPQIETKIAILTEMAERENLTLSGEVISFIAEKGPNNIRELEGVIIKLLAKASIQKIDIDLKVAQDALNQRILSEEQKFDPTRIIDFCCEYYDVPIKMLKGKGRSKEVALCRQVGMYIAKKHTNLSYKQVGIEFGGRDHSTVVHAVKTIDKKIKNDEDLQRDVKLIIEKLNS